MKLDPGAAQGMNPYEIMGLVHGADTADIKQRYVDAAFLAG